MVNKQFQTGKDSLAGLDKTGWGYGRMVMGEDDLDSSVNSVPEAEPFENLPPLGGRAEDAPSPARPAQSVAAPITPLFDSLGFQKGQTFFPDAPRAAAPDHRPSRAAADMAVEVQAAPEGHEARERGDHAASADEAARERQAEMRNLVNLAHGGNLHNAKVGLKQGEGRHGAHTEDSDKSRTRQAMISMMMQQAYQEAYNNEVTFHIGGKARQMKQGDMYKFAKEQQEKTEKELEAAKARVDHEEIALLKKDRKDWGRIAELTNPENGKTTAEGTAEIETIFDDNERAADAVEARFGIEKSIAQDTEVENSIFSNGLDDIPVSEASGFPMAAARTVSAAKVSDGSVFASAGNVTPIFGQAAQPTREPVNAPALQVAQAEPDMAIKAKAQGFNL